MACELDTPALVIDVEIARANILRFQAFCDAKGVKFRPHIKTHKNARFAQMQLEAGAIGITCQKIGEAEAFLEKGEFGDILITYNIWGAEKLARLAKLAERTNLSVVADNLPCIEGLASQFATVPKPLRVFVECDTGGARCGVQSPEEAVALAQHIAARKGLHFAGFMTYPAKGGSTAVDTFMRKAKALAEAAGLAVETITSGGTPDMYALSNDVITEYRVGTYIFNDYSLIKGSGVALADCAARVWATVVSTPTKTRAVIDAGSKVLTSDMPFLGSYGLIVGHEELKIAALSEEHGVIAGEVPTGLTVGDVIEIVPNHICVTVNMLDEYWLRDKAGQLRRAPVDARGRVR